ncbi:hypothetical protein CHS0354_010538 [Potamilus streckersoni]|uniref:Uncharacterized protein n=1 Tax=Potamilus streckersoni TaxID=2493646 RepID=A0AAE0S5H1_9BIVA|nr:hypothetical protein CHS0354_010538 [Potamilus streckersoni]
MIHTNQLKSQNADRTSSTVVGRASLFRRYCQIFRDNDFADSMRTQCQQHTLEMSHVKKSGTERGNIGTTGGAVVAKPALSRLTLRDISKDISNTETYTYSLK